MCVLKANPAYNKFFFNIELSAKSEGGDDGQIKQQQQSIVLVK